MINKLFRRSCSITPDAINSRLFNEKTFYSALQKDLRQCHDDLLIESPFLTTRRTMLLLPTLKSLVRRGVHIVINTRPPEEQEDFLRREATFSIDLLQKEGIAVLFTGGHHRKIVIIDQRILYEGSLNVLSQNESCEIMRRLDSVFLASQMIKFLELDMFLKPHHLQTS